MRFFALATDYDGTLAHHGEVAQSTVVALHRLRASGRKAILVTGRELPELQTVFPQLDLFDLVVAENGALLYFPKDGREQALAEAPPASFLQALRDRDVAPLSIGRAIVASCESQSTLILEAIRSLGLELQVIFNKGSLMILPSGVNKATGLAVALTHLGLSPHNVVGVGDAENDHALLRSCECGVAVANALPSLKQRADFVTQGCHGDGVTELIDRLIEDDLAEAAGHLSRHDILMGRLKNGAELRVPPDGWNLLVADSVACGFVERLMDAHYQVCIIDPRGRMGAFGDAVRLGDPRKGPAVDEALTALERPEHSVLMNLTAIPLEDQAVFFQDLSTRLRQLHTRTGRPHWLVMEASATPFAGINTLLVTDRPDSVPPDVISAIDVLIASGDQAEHALRTWSCALGIPLVGDSFNHLGPDAAWIWRRGETAPELFHIAPYR